VEGEVGDVMFFVEKGQANAIVEGEIVKQYTRGEFFGELALTEEGGGTRTATVLAGSEGVRCVLLGREAFLTFSSGVLELLEERQRTYAFARTTLSSSRTGSGDNAQPGESSGPVSDRDLLARPEMDRWIEG
jgi:cAMP-dependent protein kinase regulator